MMRRKLGCASLAVLLVVAAGTLAGDVLVMRDGRRFDGVVVGVASGSIEFEHRGGRDDGRVRRYDRDEIRSILFDDERGSGRGGFDSGAPPGMRERVVNVDARTQWTDAGIDLRAGQQIVFAPSGEVRWGPSRRDGAAGERNSPANRGRPMPERNAAALIGKIGPEGDPFFIGDERQPLRVRASGRLFLGINDDYLLDNSGSLRVTIGY
jgi:hypothetical protein